MAPEKGTDDLLVIHGLSVDFITIDGEVSAVKDVSFSLKKGETLALVGESGSGKSITALSILQLLPYAVKSRIAGTIRFAGRDIIGAAESDLERLRGNKIAMVFQEPMTSLNPLQTLEKQIGEVLALHKGLRGEAARKRILELMHLVGLPQPEKRLNAYPHELSGGQRQRVMIAMALANEPDLLIADEPTTALDVTVQAQILKLLKDLQKRFGMALLLITHDLGVVRKMADRICVMNKGVIVEAGRTAQIFDAPRHAYTRHLLDSEPKGSPVKPGPDAPVVLEARDMKVWFAIRGGFLRRIVDHVKAVDGIDVTVRRGQTIGVVGESGSGKSTLGNAILRLVNSQGSILYRGRDVQGLSCEELRALRREVQIVFQDPYGSLSPRKSVANIIGEGLKIHGIGGSEAERDAMIAAILDEVGLDPAVRHRFPHEFSGGQRQRIAIARAMILKPSFVVLDEPTSALDMSIQTQIIDLLRDLQKKHDLAYLFISHDLKVVKALCDEIIVMKSGKVVERGPAERIFSAPQEQYTQDLLKAAFDVVADSETETAKRPGFEVVRATAAAGN
ncbi:ABC transporter ATP-binding protein [Shinella sp.]|uniref:ABC transporter ATP-binding protein n=1 Tax=Shinella sp. TaxID=1870904 RepID=UPI0029B701F6|nr:ABC transporter ATP-binding protein [Shinella sp.]MDX3973568.1 ABC transporter ATP-binding protein [Shinella sp.]